MTDAVLTDLLPYLGVALIAAVFLLVTGREAWRSLRQARRDARKLRW